MTFDKVRHGGIERRMRIACYLALVALAMIAWSLVDPAPLPVIGAMSVGRRSAWARSRSSCTPSRPTYGRR